MSCKVNLVIPLWRCETLEPYITQITRFGIMDLSNFIPTFLSTKTTWIFSQQHRHFCLRSSVGIRFYSTYCYCSHITRKCLTSSCTPIKDNVHHAYPFFQLVCIFLSFQRVPRLFLLQFNAENCKTATQTINSKGNGESHKNKVVRTPLCHKTRLSRLPLLRQRRYGAGNKSLACRI